MTQDWIVLFCLAAVIVWAGSRLARYGDMIAEKTGMGRTWIGAVLVAATTSLPELFAGFGATAVFPLPEIAVGDVLGSCMFNLLILSLMDAVGGNVPLSSRVGPGHALSLGFGCITAGIVGLAIFAGPKLPAIGWIGISTPLLIFVYLVSARLTYEYERRRLQGQASEVAEALQYADTPLRKIWPPYLFFAIVVVAAAIFLPRTGESIAKSSGLDQSFVGALLIAIATSLPEISVSLAAVRFGAIDLAMGNVLGSNLFNILILALDDVWYRQGPLLAAVDSKHSIAVLAVLTMNGILLVGLTYQMLRKKMVLSWDTFAIAAVYVCAIALYLVL